MLQIAVCDDNNLHLKRTVSFIEKSFPQHDFLIFSFSSPESVLDCIQNASCSPDIAILGIKMKEINGIQLAERLNKLIPDCQIIYLTSYSDYASEVYLTKHVWFVLKNQTDTFLIPAMKRAIENLATSDSCSTVSVRCNGKTILLSVSDIIYLEHVGRKTRIVCENASYLSSKQPSSIQQQLVRCHQGYWVNIMHVIALDHNEFVMDTDERIPISRSYRDDARSKFFSLVQS